MVRTIMVHLGANLDTLALQTQRLIWLSPERLLVRFLRGFFAREGT